MRKMQGSSKLLRFVCVCVVFLAEARVLEATKVIVYLTVPVGCVWLYNHPLLHPYLGRHTVATPQSNPEQDAELERAMESAFRERAARIEKKEKAAAAAAAAVTEAERRRQH